MGDSFMEDITLAIMRNYYSSVPNIQFISVTKHSTGLCVSTNRNWPKKLEEFMQKHKPDVVLFFKGANNLKTFLTDKEDIRSHLPSGRKNTLKLQKA